MVGSGSAQAQVSSAPVSGLTTDADVEVLTVGAGNVLYAAGDFGVAAARAGHWVRYDSALSRDRSWPEVDGDVRAVAPDGHGGWFIGGQFWHVAGQPRFKLAHLGPAGELDPAWSPVAREPDDLLGDTASVDALCVVGDTVLRRRRVHVD